MRLRVTLLIVFLCLTQAYAQTLSPKAEISVLTVGPGNSLNDAFGHSAFRVKDPHLGIDVVYGYGAYDFDTPNFYLKFTQGKLNYMMSKTDFSRFYRIYAYYNRSIDAQTLNLDPSQKQTLYNFLISNYKPENRAYLYDFFFDNCATRIKDVLATVSHNSINFNPPSTYKDATFRTLIQNNLSQNSWGSVGIDIALGAVIDTMASPEEHMFLPENIYAFFKNTTFGATKAPLITSSTSLLEAKPAKSELHFLLRPFFILSLLALLILFITYRDYQYYKRTKLLDGIIFLVTGITGVVILLLWFATDHEATHNNYNVLWANALNILALFQISKAKVSPWFPRYLKFNLILLALLAFHWVSGVQVFAMALAPLFLALAIRYAYLTKYFSNTTVL